MFVNAFISEYARYRALGEKAMAQVSDDALNRVLSPDGNSIGIIVRHVGGNFVSRFTDFLTSDGEKPARDRDAEFADGTFTRAQVDEMWTNGWTVLEATLAELGDDDLMQTVSIRGQGLSVHDALCRSLSHAAYHTGQIVLLSRILATDDWKTLTIPKGKSKEYNLNPTGEKRVVR